MPKEKDEKQPQKSQQEILQHTNTNALEQLDRKTLGLVLSGISAGLDIGFSVLLMSIALSGFQKVFPHAVTQTLVSNMYPIGFLFVVLGRSELFTEHTTLAVLPVLQGQSSFKKLFRLWGIVYVSNLVGGALFAGLLSYFAKNLHFLHKEAFAEISGKFAHYSWLTLLLTGVLAGWMMGLLAWLVAAAKETISQIVIIWIITAAIGLAGLSHCIVGNIEMLAGMFTGSVSFSQYLNFMSAVTLGNVLGGSVFVGIIKYSHTAFSGKAEEGDVV